MRRRLTGFAAAALVVTITPVAGGTGPGVETLRADNATLASRSHTALLSLYSIESRLTQARSRLGSLESRAAAIGRERTETAHDLGLARRGLAVSQRQLAERLRILYEQGDVSPLEILLGAKSVDEALTGLDNLDRMATQDRSVLAEVKGARAQLERFSQRLAARAAAIDRLRSDAAATAASLASARAERSSYVQNLALQQRMNSSRISTIETQASAAAARSVELARQPVPTVSTTEAAPPMTSGGGRTITVSATGYALPGRAATGIPVGWGVIAVDPSVIPLGTRMTVPGYGEGIAADTGGAIQGATIDLWFPSVAQAQTWGRRTVTIVLH